MTSETPEDRKSTCKAPQTLEVPAIVACGYKRVTIPKSGNTFPALLVAFQGDNGNLRLAWRSKKDFLLLARKATTTNFPKAALKKVVDEKTVPWRRSKNIIPKDLLCPNLPNHHTARMKKSIWLLDRFLQSMKSNAQSSEQMQNAWDLFSRHSDTEDLVALQEISTSNKDCTIDAFHTRGVATTLRESSRLGQYFASKENSQKVVEYTLQKILPLYQSSKTFDKNTKNPKILFIEPSCGHGDIVLSLVEALKEHNIPPSAVKILGYDIDPGAIQICRERKDLLPMDKNSMTQHHNSSDYTIFWECKSFFETKRIDQLGKSFHNDKDSEVLVCCLGGPPYTTGQGSGSNMKRDLPEQFVDHCIHEWKTKVISFLLPARYAEETQKVLCDGSLVTTASSSSSATKRWVRETHALEASKFFFRGTTEVTQPSIIKLFYESGGLPKLYDS